MYQSLFHSVEYDPEVQEKMMEIFLFHTCHSYDQDKNSNFEDKWASQLDDIYSKSEKLLNIISFFKDPSFAFEKECRLIYIEDRKLNKMFGLNNAPKNFRVSKGRIIPYAPSTDILPSKDRNYPLVIDEVITGPNSDELLERGIREFLDSNGLKDVKINSSNLSFRS